MSHHDEDEGKGFLHFIGCCILVFCACALYTYDTALYALGIGAAPGERFHPTPLVQSPLQSLRMSDVFGAPTPTSAPTKPPATVRPPQSALRQGSNAYTVVRTPGYSLSQVPGNPGPNGIQYWQLNQPGN